MKSLFIANFGISHLPASVLAIIFYVASTAIALADSREEARGALSQIEQSVISQTHPSEAESAATAFSIAEQYRQQQKPEIAERFYLLTIQKVRLLLSASIQPPLPANTPNTIDAVPSAAPSSEALRPQVQEVSESQQATEDDSSDTIELKSSKIVGSVSYYTVRKSDSLRLVAAKLGVSRQQLVKLNKLDPKAPLKVGQQLKYNNRKIIPIRMKSGIVINIPDRTLYYFRDGRLTTSLPVALGSAVKNDKFDWTTPVGRFKITAKQKDPVWYVPKSIQTEMGNAGKEVVTSVPPGPQNPLGKYAIKTSLPGILIHSTTKPGSIYSFASHGCIRVTPEHMESFFNEVSVNTPGQIIYRPVKVAITENGRVFLEVHQDVYGKSIGLEEETRQLLERHRLLDRVDWTRVEQIIRQKSGTAEDITL